MLKPNNRRTLMQEEYQDDKGKTYYIDVCPYFEVKRLIKKLPISLNLPDEYEIYFTDGSKEGLFRISTEQIYDNVELAKIFGRNHFYVKRCYKDIVIDEIMDQADKIDSKNIYSYENRCLGWLNVENKKVFVYDSKIINGHSCECIRNCGNFINGDEKIYDKMISENVLDNTPMTLAYVLGFAGVVISRISNIKDLGVMVVGLTGTSSKGKTTALKLIAPIWGDPDECRGSLILRNKGSEIGFETQQAGLFGVPILFDDLDTNKKINIGDYIYELSKGTQRVLSKANGETDLSRMGFSGISIITGENPLLQSGDQRMGLSVRVIDLRDIVQAKDGNSANKIKSCIFNNYGFKGKKFAEFIEKKQTVIYQ